MRLRIFGIQGFLIGQSKLHDELQTPQQVDAWVKREADVLLGLQWSPEQIAGKLPVSHGTLYLHLYTDKAKGGKLWENLRCQKQKRKRYAGGHDRRGQIPNRRPLSERPAHVEDRKHVGH